MSYGTLSIIVLIGLLGPLLALPTSWHLPIVLGELLGGILLGSTGLGYLKSSDPTFTFLANLGFALVMFIVGSHVPIRDPGLRRGARRGLLRAMVVGVAAAALGLIFARAIDPRHAIRAAIGALFILIAAAVLFLFLDYVQHTGARARLHRLSERRKFALELRISLVILFALAALAVHGHVSIMLAGFACGLVVSAVGQPRRLARQLFALAEGFLAPLFFVWLGASLDLRELSQHPQFIGLGVALGLGAVLAHAVTRLLGQPWSLGFLAGGQLGVPVAAATVGAQLGVLRPGEPAALILGALVTIAVAVGGGSLAARSGFSESAGPVSPAPKVA